MTAKEFANKNDLSHSKVKQMAPYISGATKCPCCGGWNIPDTARPIYIPDKRKYTPFSKIYCYVLDAIALEMDLLPSISRISVSSLETALRELYKNNLIVRKEGAPEDSLNLCDYIPSLRLNKWQHKENKEKVKLICETIQSCSSAITELAKSARQFAV